MVDIVKVRIWIGPLRPTDGKELLFSVFEIEEGEEAIKDENILIDERKLK